MSAQELDALTRSLTKALSKAQDLSLITAQNLAVEIVRSGNGDVLDAVRVWIDTGRMPADPTIAGISPVELDREFFPSQTFTILVGLARDPDATRRTMRHLPGRRAKANTSDDLGHGSTLS